MNLPRFTVVLVHCQKITSDTLLLRGVDCILAQTYKNYELLLFHNGPLTDESIVEPLAKRGLKFRCTEKFRDDFGFEQRHRGIYAANGDYILNFNSDNELDPVALQEISDVIDRTDPQPNLIIFQIWTDTRNNRRIMTGVPPREWQIDCLQGVARRSAWLENGGWTERGYTADGLELTKLAQKYGYTALPKVLGMHN